MWFVMKSWALPFQPLYVSPPGPFYEEVEDGRGKIVIDGLRNVEQWPRAPCLHTLGYAGFAPIHKALL